MSHALFCPCLVYNIYVGLYIIIASSFTPTRTDYEYDTRGCDVVVTMENMPFESFPKWPLIYLFDACNEY